MAFLKWLVRLVLASVFIAAGTVKLAPNLSQDMHDFMGKEYIKFATVSPLKRIGLELRAEQYMQLTGMIEVICSPLLIIGSRSLRTLCNLALTVVMIVAIYTLYALQYKSVEFIPAIVCLSLLLLDRHVLDNGNESSDVKTKRS